MTVWIRSRILCALLAAPLLGAFSPAIYHGISIAPTTAGAFDTLSQSATTIYGQWTAPGIGSGDLACGTTAGVFNIPEVPNDAQARVQNDGIMAGLTPSTVYYCRERVSVNGTLYDFTGSVTTNALPASTPITAVSFGSAVRNSMVQPSTAYLRGDQYWNHISNDGSTYSTFDDGFGWNDGYMPDGANMALSKFTSLGSPLTGVDINAFSAFGIGAACGLDNLSPKISGLVSHSGTLYMAYNRLWEINAAGCTGPPPGAAPPANNYTSYAAGILKSTDKGATLCNWLGQCGANGVVPPITSTMFPDIYTFRIPSFVVYGADDGTLGYRVDNADAYAYLSSGDIGWAPNDNWYLARIPWKRLPYLSPTDIEYYHGGDGNLNSAWSHTWAGAAAIISNTGKLGSEGIYYIPRLNYYVTFPWYYTTPGTISDTTWTTYVMPHPWTAPTSLGTQRWATQGFYTPNPIHSTAIAGGTDPLTLAMTGNFNDLTWYNVYTVAAQLECGGSPSPC